MTRFASAQTEERQDRNDDDDQADDVDDVIHTVSFASMLDGARKALPICQRR
jgi:hypothetical protein